MVSNVNKNFVVLLVTGIIALVGVVGGFATYTFFRSGERNIGRGDAAMAAGDYKGAHTFYSRAVSRDRSRVEWLEKWRGALVKWVPQNEVEYRQAYSSYYLGCLRSLALAQSRDPKAQEAFLIELDSYMRKGSGGSAGALQTFIRDVEDRLKLLPQEDKETKRLYRYRGLALLDLWEEQPVTDEQKARSMDDLKGAAAVDPADHEVRLAIVRWHMRDAAEKSNSRRDTDANAARQKGLDELAAFLKEDPSQPEALVMDLLLKQSFEAEKAVTMAEKVGIVAKLQPAANELMKKLSEAKAESLRTDLLWTVVTRVRPLLGAEGAKATLGLVERALTVNPSDPELLMMASEMTYESGDIAGTFTRFQKVADLPDLAVSRRGMMLPNLRRVAIGRQVDTALDQWRRATDDKAKAEAMTQAKAYREKLKGAVDVNSESELKLRDAYIAVAENKNDVAIALLNDIRSVASKSSDSRVLLPLAEVLNRVGNSGEAAIIYDKLIEQGYLDVGVLSAAGLVHMRLQNTDKAREYFEKALALDPQNDALQRLAASTRQAQAAVEGKMDDVSDPVVKAIVKISTAMKDGVSREARTQMEELYKSFPNDPRVIRFYVNTLLQDDNRQRAMEVLDKAIAADPKNTDWPKLKVVVETPDRDEAMLKLIDQSNDPPVDKLVRKYQVYVRQGKKAEADAAYADAVKLEPDNAAVVEMGFMRALEKVIEHKGATQGAARAEGEAEAQKFVTKATERNIDQLGGMLYRARLLMAQEKFRDAALVLKQATDKVPTNPNAFRLMASAYMESGQVNEGLTAYQRALDGRPNDGGIAKDYARALVRVARGNDALKIINPDTGALKFSENAGDEELVSMWLDLEAKHAGPAGIAKAIDRRRLIFNRRPEMMMNTVALARLLIGNGGFDEAEKVITAIETQKDAKPELVTRLRADWFAAQRKYDEGANVYKTFLDKKGDKVGVADWLLYAEWLLDYERPEEALLAMTEARKYQTAAHEADRTMGDFLFNGFGRLYDDAQRARKVGREDAAKELEGKAKAFLAGAEEAYKAIIDGDADDAAQGFPVLKRLCETQIRLEKYDDASKTLERLVQVAPASMGVKDDLQVILLQGTIAEKKGDVRGARKLYDTAVEKYPGDHRTYTARAILNAKEPALFPDVVADLTQVTRMQPANSLAWNMLFELHEQKGLSEQAFSLLTKAVDANPSNDDLSQLFIERLNRTGRKVEALGHMLKVVNRDKKTDPVWVRQAATYAMGLEAFREAADMYRLLLTIPGYDVTENRSFYLHCLLKRMNPLPERAEVGKLLRQIEEDSAAQELLATVMLRARAEAFLGDTDKGITLARQGYKKAETSRQVYGWFNDTTDMIYVSFKKGNVFYRDLPDGRRQAQKEVFDRFRKDRQPPPPILVIMEVPFRQQAGESIQKLLDEIVALESQLGDDLPAKVEMYRAMNQLYYALGKYPEALEACKKGLEIAPTEVEFNNNAAYTLSKHLDKPQEALPFALAAARGAGDASPVLDTVGQVYLQMNDVENAIRFLTRAADNARGPDEVVAANVHLGMARMMMKPADIAAARKCYDRAREAHAKMPEAARKQFDADLDSLRQKVQ